MPKEHFFLTDGMYNLREYAPEKGLDYHIAIDHWSNASECNFVSLLCVSLFYQFIPHEKAHYPAESIIFCGCRNFICGIKTCRGHADNPTALREIKSNTVTDMYTLFSVF